MVACGTSDKSEAMKKTALSLALVLALCGTAFGWTDTYNDMWTAFLTLSDQIARKGQGPVMAPTFILKGQKAIDQELKKGNITQTEAGRLRRLVLGSYAWLADGGLTHQSHETTENIMMCIEKNALRNGPLR